jgi:dTDP-4-amino-4,6-dideoxy-D-galactose acyltransferase
MPSSNQALVTDSRLLVREAGQNDLENPALVSRYFVSAAPGIGRDLETTALQTVLRVSLAPGRVQIFANGGGGEVACLLVDDKPWDSAMTSTTIRGLVVLASESRADSRYEITSRLLEGWLDASAKTSEQLVVTRIPADDIAVWHALEDADFHALVPMVTLGWAVVRREKIALPPGISVSPIAPSQIHRAENIAAKAFLWGRFTVDPWIPEEGAERIHRAWTRNCCLGTHAKHVLVARRKDDVLGFIALKFQMAGTVQVGSIELIATAETSRGTGIGRALVQAGCNWLSDTVEYVVVRTELPNIPALRLYESQGFRVLNSSLYLSRWGNSSEH